MTAPLSDAAVQGLIDAMTPHVRPDNPVLVCLAELLEGRARLATVREICRGLDGGSSVKACIDVLVLLDAPVELCAADVCSADGEHFPAPVDRIGG